MKLIQSGRNVLNAKNLFFLGVLIFGLSTMAAAQQKDSVPSEKAASETVPFDQLTKLPEFPNTPPFKTQTEANQYFTKRLQKFVGMYFDSQNVLPYMDSTATRVTIIVSFTISRNGNVRDVTAHSANPQAEQEGIRVVRLLPRFIPAELNGQAVPTVYRLPITFQIN